MTWFEFLDIFFFVFHLALVVFNLFGWIWKKTRFWNLIALLLTLASWFLLGLFYGIGYCPLTEWHWQILRELGETGLPSSYINYLIFRITGQTLPARLVDNITVIAAFIAFVLSLTLNIRDRARSKKS